MNGLDRWGYCRYCWCELPGFPEPEGATVCPGCYVSDGHVSHCATHNEPAYPNGACDCGALAA